MKTGRRSLEQIAGGDPLTALSNSDARVRRVAIAAAAGLSGEDTTSAIVERLTDPDENVRAEAVEVLGERRVAAAIIEPALTDSSARVVEAAATALGEIADPDSVPRLMDIAATHEELLVREAAIAALGAIGDPAGLPLLIDVVKTGKPQLRRRAVVALTAFDGPEVEAALAMAGLDRNPMVREVADMLLGRKAQ